ncbi:MAG TPA: PKD domain-containing protein [Luteolibacter sp.]|nr:PKD domain-containing protein [Luteolibacter sp.]
MNRKALFVPVFLVVILVGILIWRAGERKPEGSVSIPEPVKVEEGVAQVRGANERMRKLMAEEKGGGSGTGVRADRMGEIVRVARERRDWMKRLIRENPERALAESLGFAEYAALPEEAKAFVERPFSALVKLEVYPICGNGPRPPGTPDALRTITFGDGMQATPFPQGRRDAMMSKTRVPLTGIVLDDVAALHERTLVPVSPDDLAALGQPVPGTSLVSGKTVNGPLIAVAGGKVFAFADEAELGAANGKLAELDDKPDPHLSSEVIFQASAGEGETSLFALADSAMAKSTWTETQKRIFMIRIDTSDKPGAPFTQAEVAASFNGAVNDNIIAFSHGKTSVVCTVSANVYRLPQTSVYYSRSDQAGYPALTSRNTMMLQDARDVFRAQRSGADAAINIGPLGNGGGLGDYDIVGIVFGSYGMSGGSFAYGGLAGGSNLWLQNSIGTSLVVHELGHNYGVGHSNLWLTTNGSIAGTGTSDEYGDDFDVMGDGGVPVDHFSAAQKAKLDWLAASDWVAPSTSQTVRLHGIDYLESLQNPRGVRLTKSGSDQFYWLTYRPRSTNAAMRYGLHLAWVHGTHDLLDTIPSTSGDVSDAGLTLGRTYSDTTTGVHVTPLSRGGSVPDEYIDVRVNIGSFSGNGSPSASAISGASTVAARTASVFSVSATDPNSDTLAYAWNTADGAFRDSANSISKAWTIGGTYPVACTVSDMKGGTVTVNKTVTVTDPLLTWTSSQLPGTSNPVVAVAWGEHRFAALGYFGTPYFSWDGVTWQGAAGSTGVTSGTCSLAYGAGIFVAAGEGTDAATDAGFSWSEDGRKWQAATFPATAGRVEEVAWGGNEFLAVASSGHVFRSADGKTWTVSLVAGAPLFNHVCRDGNVWVASTSTSRKLLTSADGVNWTERLATGIDVHGVVSHDGRLFLTGWYGGIRHSEDQGETWTDGMLPAGTRWSTWAVRRAHDGTLVCAAKAMDESGSPYTILVSSDGGISWSRPATNQPAGDAYDMAFGDGRFVVVASGGNTFRSDLIDVTDQLPAGVAVTPPASAAARTMVAFGASANDPDNDPLTYVWDFGVDDAIQEGASIYKSFPVGGSRNVTLRVYDGRSAPVVTSTTVTVTDPLASWTQASITNDSGFTPSGPFMAAAAGNGRIVAVGTLQSGSFRGPVAISTDSGATWSGRQLATNSHLQSLIFDGTNFIGSGTKYGFDGTAGYRAYIATSPDGMTWTDRYFAENNKHQRAIAWNGNIGAPVYLSCGDSGSLYRSTNGTTWTAVATTAFLPSGATLGALAFGNGTFVMTSRYTTGTGERAFVSSDGLSWTDVSPGSTVTENNHAGTTAFFANNRFVVSGDGYYTSSGSKVLTSFNNGQSFSSTRTRRENLEGLAFGGGVYFGAGLDMTDGNYVDLDLVSQDAVAWYTLSPPTTVDRKAVLFHDGRFYTFGDNLSIWRSAALTGGAGYSNWLSNHFPGGVPSIDPDNDGLRNPIEYAFGLDPKSSVAVPGILPSSAVMTGGRQGVEFRVPSPASAEAVYQIQVSTALGTWDSIARRVGTGAWQWLGGGTSQLDVQAPSGGAQLIRAGLPDSLNNVPKAFFRVTVEVP